MNSHPRRKLESILVCKSVLRIRTNFASALICRPWFRRLSVLLEDATANHGAILQRGHNTVFMKPVPECNLPFGCENQSSCESPGRFCG